jgi:hypothetical protein
MSTLAGDFWVCGQCRSINNAGAKQCYNCRTPKDRAAVDPATIDPTTKGQLLEIALPEFRSSRWAALLASILILVVAVMQIVQWNLAATLIDQTLRGVDATEDQFAYIGSVGFLALGIALLALIAWSLWLSRTVTSMPALGLGYPAASGLMAFVENFIPVFNLFRVPAIVRDVVHRLEPKASRGEALIFAAWIGLLGGFIVPRVLGFFINDLRTAVTVSGIATGLMLIGAIFLVALIWWIEGRVARRRAEQLAGSAPASATPTTPLTPIAAPHGEPDAVSTRSAFAAAGSVAEASAAPPPSAHPTASPPPFSLPRVDAAPATNAWNEATVTPEPAPAPAPQPGPPPGPAMPEPEPVAESSPEPVIAAMEPETPAVVVAPEPEPGVAAASPAPALAVEPEPRPGPPEVAANAETADGPPHLTIRVTPRGMITAEMDGETEHVILDDLEAYGSALAKVDGTAAIVAATEDSMAALIARRAQRILEEAGVQVTVH